MYLLCSYTHTSKFQFTIEEKVPGSLILVSVVIFLVLGGSIIALVAYTLIKRRKQATFGGDQTGEKKVRFYL